MRRSVRALAAAACVLAVACSRRWHDEEGPAPGAVQLPRGAVPVPDVDPSSPALPAPAAPAGPVAVRTEPVSFAPIAKAADPSVVTIFSFTQEDVVSPFFGRRQRKVATGLGTGFVVDRGGVILTNNHVVEGADALLVKLADDRQLPGKLVATDRRTDLAVIRVDAKDLRPLPLGDSDVLDVGDWVVAIGNPFGLSHTVSAGIISAKGRTPKDLAEGQDPEEKTGEVSDTFFLQTDASINPGNSGGPMLNLQGAVVGVNTAIRAGGAQGIGFAIPINMVKQLLPMMLRDGHVTRSALGVYPADLSELAPDDRDALKLKPDDHAGAVLLEVFQGTPADRAGLEPGDIILAWDGQPITGKNQLRWVISTAGVGRTVTLRVQRMGKRFDVKATLAQLRE
jgi:serine protease Do